MFKQFASFYTQGKFILIMSTIVFVCVFQKQEINKFNIICHAFFLFWSKISKVLPFFCVCKHQIVIVDYRITNQLQSFSSNKLTKKNWKKDNNSRYNKRTGIVWIRQKQKGETHKNNSKKKVIVIVNYTSCVYFIRFNLFCLCIWCGGIDIRQSSFITSNDRYVNTDKRTY